MWQPAFSLDFERWTKRYHRWGHDPVNVVSDQAFHRVVADIVYQAAHHDGTIVVACPDHANAAVERDITYRLGEQLPFGRLTRLAESNQRVADLTARYPGLRLPMTPDPFETLIGAITAQQVNLAWATTTRRRLVEATSSCYQFDDTDVWRFPTPTEVAALDVSDYRAMQFTTRKSEFILDLASAALEGSLDGLHELPNAEVLNRLTAIRGIGRWSAELVLGRCLGRMDVVAAGDLAVRKAVSFTYLGSDTILSEDTVRATTTEWGDAANLVAHLLLETLSE